MERMLTLLLSLILSGLLLIGVARSEELPAEAYAAAKTARHDAAVRMADRMTTRIDAGDLDDLQLAEAFRNRGVARNYLLDYAGALKDFDRAIQLQQVTPQYYEDRAIVYLKLRDYAKADTDLEMTLGLDSKRASAFREKGRLAAYQGDYDRAVMEFGRAVQNSEGEAAVYGALWLHIALARAGRGQQTMLKDLAAQLNPGAWPYPVLLMFLGEASVQTTIQAAGSPVAEQALMRRCEAWFYAGEKYLIDGDTEHAREAFKAAVATQVTDFLEYDWATRELERLDGGR